MTDDIRDNDANDSGVPEGASRPKRGRKAKSTPSEMYNQPKETPMIDDVRDSSRARFEGLGEVSRDELCRMRDPNPRVARFINEETRRAIAVRFDDAMEPSDWVRYQRPN